MPDIEPLKQEYLEHQAKDNLLRFLVVPILLIVISLVFFGINWQMINSGEAHQYTKFYLGIWSHFIITSVIFGVWFRFLNFKQNFTIVNRSIFIYVLLICIGASFLSALDSSERSNMSAYGFTILGVAISYRTRTRNYILIVLCSIAAYNYFYFGLLDYDFAAKSIAPALALGTLGGFIAYSLESNRKKLMMMSFELEQTNKRLKEESLIDPLTKLYNRRLLSEFLPREIASFKRTGERLCVAMGDLDYFKSVNDEYGHLAGDEVLRIFAKMLADESRSSDVVIRYGGEEFLITMPHTTMPDALNLIERVREKLSRTQFDFMRDSLTVSFGVTEVQLTDDADVMLNRVDKLLYQAKEQGRNRVTTDH